MEVQLTLLISTLEDLDSKELKKFKLYLSEDILEDVARMPRGKLPENSDETHIAREMTNMYGINRSLMITLHILREIKNNQLAARLEEGLKRIQTNTQIQSSNELSISASDAPKGLDHELQSLKTAIQADLKRRFRNIVEGASPKHPVSLNKVFVELYITEGGTGDINSQHEVRQTEVTRQMKTNRDTPIKCTDLFKSLPGQNIEIGSVLTKGIAGIGKTVSVHKFILDWAEEKENREIAVIVSIPFRDLHGMRGDYSLIHLLHDYCPQLKGVKNLENIAHRMLIIMDGLDECRHPLDFQNSLRWSDISKPTSIGVLLTNLINGKLLPSVLKWITSRPAAASQIPSDCIQRVTEVRGFSDSQKMEYFRKRFENESMTNTIVTQIQKLRTLYIMCHIPVFCWIAATVFENMFQDTKSGELPQTLTEMYTDFLIIQMCIKNKKYNGGDPKSSGKLSNFDKEMILKLGELSFNELVKGNLNFNEEDLKEYDIDVKKASEYSSLCTEIFREEKGLYVDEKRLFCFVHLTIQEFLAAVYVHVSCVQKNVDVLSLQSCIEGQDQVRLSDVHMKAVENALLSPNGHFDLFLRFLLGLSCDNKQPFLQLKRPSKMDKIKRLLRVQTLHVKRQDPSECADETIKFIKQKMKTVCSPERTYNLMHCLSEMKDNSLVAEIQNEIKSGTLSHIEPDKCSALTYAVLMSDEVLDTFALKEFRTSDDGRERLLGLLKACKNGRLDRCHLTSESCKNVALALRTENSPLRQLDLSYNSIGDEGVKLLCSGLQSSHCKLAKLRLEGCHLTTESCENVALALQRENSPLRELDLSYNNIGNVGVKSLCCGLQSSRCKLEKLCLEKCNLSKNCCQYLCSVIEALDSSLTELDLSHNELTDLGMVTLCNGFMTTHCKLSSLKVAGCSLTSKSCESLAHILQSEESSLGELNLNYNDLRDVGVRLLCEGLMSSNCNIQTLKLMECSLTYDSCVHLSTVLSSPTSKLKRLQLRDNDLYGMNSLCHGLGHSNCTLQSLGLVGCQVREEGFFSLARALDKNPSHLKKLYLNFNNPGEHGLDCLSKRKMHPDYKLDTLIVGSSGDFRINAGPKKYSYSLILDSKTEYKMLSLSDGNRKVTSSEMEQGEIILSEGALTKHCYWEVEVSGGRVDIGVSSKTTSMNDNKWQMPDDQPGAYKSFPCLVVYQNKLHGFLQKGELFASCPVLSCPVRIGVYLNKKAEYLSFYHVSKEKFTLLGQFYSMGYCKVTSAGDLFAAFRLYSNSSLEVCTP